MDFSLTTLFVLGNSNTLPTTGSTADLTAGTGVGLPGQFGVFKPDYTPATAGNVASQPYILLAQGRQPGLPGVGTKKSDKIYLNHVSEWYKVTANSTVNPQIVEITGWNAGCGEDVTISLRLKSFYVDTGYYNGKTQSYTLTTPCCNCGDDPCSTMADADIISMIKDFVDKINDTNINGNNPLGPGSKNANSISSLVTASYATGSGAGNRKLVITGKALATEPTSADPTVFQYQYDRLYFWAFAYKGPATSQDYNTWDACDVFATATTTQTANYVNGDYKQAAQLEKNFYSNNTAQIAKRIWSNVNFNQAFISEVSSAYFYDFYYLKFANSRKLPWVASVGQDESVIILNPTGTNATTIAVLTAFLGNPIDASA